MFDWFDTPVSRKGTEMKKYIVALLMGAFLFVSLAATSGCSETKTGTTETKKTETKTEKSGS